MGWVERWMEDRRIDRHNESPSAIPQQKERVIPPALARRGTAGKARMTGLLQQPVKWLKKRYQPLRYGAICLSSSSGVRVPRNVFPLMKKVGVELTLNFCVARVRSSTMLCSIW